MLPELLRRLTTVADELRARYTLEFICVDDGSMDDKESSDPPNHSYRALIVLRDQQPDAAGCARN